ncbi:hypothetical protein, partial [Variovorax sp.]|uniref:hypothetical protein n=1 Tax=Variovorax sp. TaxID=1871043 RepID=UPI0025FE1BFD
KAANTAALPRKGVLNLLERAERSHLHPAVHSIASANRVLQTIPRSLGGKAFLLEAARLQCLKQAPKEGRWKERRENMWHIRPKSRPV